VLNGRRNVTWWLSSTYFHQARGYLPSRRASPSHFTPTVSSTTRVRDHNNYYSPLNIRKHFFQWKNCFTAWNNRECNIVDFRNTKRFKIIIIIIVIIIKALLFSWSKRNWYSYCRVTWPDTYMCNLHVVLLFYLPFLVCSCLYACISVIHILY